MAAGVEYPAVKPRPLTLTPAAVAAKQRNQPVVHPLAKLGKAALERKLKADPASLGSVSLGRPQAGALFNGIQMPKGSMWRLVNPVQTWGTEETVDALIRVIKYVNAKHPGTPPLYIGDISEKHGGHVRPHISHQSGRDIDLGFYYTTGAHWFRTATRANLDLARTWTLIRAFIMLTDVERIFIDRRVQKLLRNYAASIGEDAAWLDSIFGGPRSTDHPLIIHEPGHRSHLHVRLYNPIAQESGRRLYRLLLTHKFIKPPTYYIRYKCRRGDTLGRIARRFGTSVRALKRANRLRSSRIYAGRKYKIPRRGGVTRVAELNLPPRRIPPPRDTSASVGSSARADSEPAR